MYSSSSSTHLKNGPAGQSLFPSFVRVLSQPETCPTIAMAAVGRASGSRTAAAERKTADGLSLSRLVYRENSALISLSLLWNKSVNRDGYTTTIGMNRIQERKIGMRVLLLLLFYTEREDTRSRYIGVSLSCIFVSFSTRPEDVHDGHSRSSVLWQRNSLLGRIIMTGYSFADNGGVNCHVISWFLLWFICKLATSDDSSKMAADVLFVENVIIVLYHFRCVCHRFVGSEKVVITVTSHCP